MAVQFDGGVVIGADSRTTTGSYIVSVSSFGFLGAYVVHTKYDHNLQAQSACIPLGDFMVHLVASCVMVAVCQRRPD